MTRYQIERIRAEVLVVGSGLAGLRAALAAREAGKDVLILSRSPLGQANNTAISLGGLACWGTGSDQDNPESHFQDTMRTGRGLSDPSLVEILVNGVGNEIKRLEHWGVKFRKEGDRFVVEGRGGHSFPRRVSSYRATGADILAPLRAASRKAGIRHLEGVAVVNLILKEESVAGALGISREGQPLAIESPAIVLATGGGGALFPYTTNVKASRGDGYILAYDAGATLRDMEFIQFLTAMARKGKANMQLPPLEYFLVGRLGDLRNHEGVNLLEIWGLRSPEKMTRDAIAIHVSKEKSRERGSGVLFHATGLRGSPRDKLPAALMQCKGSMLNDILAGEPIEVQPFAHYFLGGVAIDGRARTGVDGLFAAGEVTGGLHGANRLGGNGLAEALVFGAIAGREAAGATGSKTGFDLSDSAILDIFEQKCRALAGTDKWEILKGKLQEAAEVTRSGDRIRSSLASLESLGLPDAVRPLATGGIFKPGDAAWQSSLALSKIILRAAEARRETRGAHYRDDFPSEDPTWGSSIMFSLRHGMVLPTEAQKETKPGG